MSKAAKVQDQRDSCIRCALKHIAQARVLLLESKKGYEFVVYAIGHLAEAEDELIRDHRDQAMIVREQRLLLEFDSEYDMPFRDLVLGLHRYDEKLADEILEELENGRTSET